MGSQFVQFKCHHCNHCCTEVVCVPTPWDVVRIVRETGANPYAFLEFLKPDEIAEVEEDDPTWLDVNGQRYIMGLRRDANGCYFLDKETRYCSIYASRPILCRLYPFSYEEDSDGSFSKFSLHVDVGCPRHRDGRIRVQPLLELFNLDRGHQDDYARLVKVFNGRRYAGKKPEDFLDMFLEMSDDVKKRLKKEARVIIKSRPPRQD